MENIIEQLKAELDERPYSVNDASVFLNLQRGTVYNYASKGRIKHYKPNGGKIYFMKQDLLDYILNPRKETA